MRTGAALRRRAGPEYRRGTQPAQTGNGRQNCSPGAIAGVRAPALRSTPDAGPRNRSQQPDRIRMLRRVEQGLHRAALDDAPRVHHDHVIGHFGHHTQVMRDQHDGGCGFLLQAAHQFQDLRLYGHVERGRRLVGNQQPRLAGQSHRDHHALAHAPAELVRKFVDALLRRRDPYLAQHLDGPLTRLWTAHPAMAQQAFDDLLANGECRIERGHRLLKDHGDPVATQVLQRGFGRTHQFLSLEPYRAAGDAPMRLGQQAHDGQGGHALATSGLAHDGQRAAGVHRKADSVDDRELAVVPLEDGAQIAYFKQAAHRTALLAACAAIGRGTWRWLMAYVPGAVETP
jgi:hypothetical protein